MNKFLEGIRVEYPPNNKIIFEEWFAANYTGCKTDRELLPFFPTSYFVNNGYNENLTANQEAQRYIDSLDRRKKYFSIIQYDNGIYLDVSKLDLLQFNMSKKLGVEMPLICQPHPYEYSDDKRYIASFIGSRTHPIRDTLEQYKNTDGWYISFEPHNIEKYCEIMSQSLFSLCPRGYGANSFRVCESLQFGSIPIVITDTFINCFDADFSTFGGSINDTNLLRGYIESFSQSEIIELALNGIDAYKKYYTYEGAMQNIIKILESENNPTI